MEEKVQEMLNRINEKYNDFEIRSVDLSLLRKLEYLANKVAIPSHELYFKFDVSRSEKASYIAETEDIFRKILLKERLGGYYSDRYRYYVLPFNAEVLHYSVL